MKIATIALGVVLLASCTTVDVYEKQIPEDLYSFRANPLFLPGNGVTKNALDYERREIERAKIVALARVVPRGEKDYYYAAEVLKDQTGTVKAGDMLARWDAGVREAIFHKWRLLYIDEIGRRGPNGSAVLLHEEPWSNKGSLSFSQFRELVNEMAKKAPDPTPMPGTVHR